MSIEWERVSLGDVCADVRYGYTASAKTTPTPVKFLRITDIAQSFLDWDEVPFCDISEADLQRHRLEHGDIVIARMGTIGVSTIVKNPPLAVAASYLIRHRVDHSRVNPQYLAYVLKSPAFDQFVWAHGGTGAVQPNINARTLGQFSFLLPPLDEQHRIAATLGALDDKIELNRRMSETLYDIAASIFEAMFLVPTHDSSGGSEVTESTIGEEVEVTMGQSPPGSTYNTEGRGLPFYQGRADFGFLFPSRRVYCTAPTRYAQAGDTLLSVRAPVGDTNVAIEDCAIGRGVAALRHKSGSSVFTYFLARSLHVALDQFNGEGTVFGSISKKALLGLACPKPSSAMLHTFEEVGAPILQRIRLAVQESHSLASLRDALLPKLISGELRVPEAEQLVSEVA